VANFLERNANSVFSEPNPENETIDYNELSLVQRWSDSLSSFATFYYADINNLIHQDFLWPIYFNPPPIRSHGVEFGVDKRWARGMSLIANLAVQRSRLRGGFGIANSPEFIGKMRFSMPLGNSDFTLSLNSYGVSKRRTFDSHLPGYVSHDVSLNWQNSPDLFVALGVRNITDKDILEITDGGFTPYLQRRRQVHLSVNWSWNND
jgi:outer membrane receptor protein involved in Fe transport